MFWDAVSRNAAKDFFISDAAVDEPWAKSITVTLDQAGYTTLVQAFDLRPGDDFMHSMHEATTTSSHVDEG
jgi:hypothetical protein